MSMWLSMCCDPDVKYSPFREQELPGASRRTATSFLTSLPPRARLVDLKELSRSSETRVVPTWKAEGLSIKYW